MNEKPKISIVIPVFNQESYIEECIRSILEQSFDDYEVILVDDASTDKTFEIVNVLIGNDSRFKVISYEKNKGTSQARKDAILATSGKYVLFVDPDDSLNRDACRIAYEDIEREGVDILQFGTNVVNCGVNDTAYQNFANHCAPYPDRIERDTLFFACFEEKLFNFNLWNKIYNGDMTRRAFAAVKDGYYPKAQDMYAFVLMSYYAKSYASVSKKLYNYNFGRGITGSRSIKLDRFYKISTQMHIIEQLYKFIDSEGLAEWKHYAEVLGHRGKIFFNEVYANFTYVENFDENAEAALGYFLAGLAPVEDEPFNNSDIRKSYIGALFSYVDELYYHKNIGNAQRVFDWAAGLAFENRDASPDSFIFREAARLWPVFEAKRTIIPVVFATNDNYAPYLGVTIASLIEHSSNEYVYDIYIFNTSLSEINKRKLTSMSCENVCIRTVDVLPYVRNIRAYSHSHYSVEMYYRILIPEILSRYDKAVYLDCDLVLTHDVAALYNVELGDNVVAAVVNDIVSDTMKKYLANTVCIGLDEYFNSGVLVINTGRFIAEGIKERCFKLLDEFKRLMCPDQDILNISCRGKVLYLENYWNFQVGSGAYSTNDKYLRDHAVIHYTTGNKPWNTEGMELGDKFWYYARKTPYYEDIIKTYIGATLKLTAPTAEQPSTVKPGEKKRNIINECHRKKSKLSWPIRMVRNFFVTAKNSGLRVAFKRTGIKLAYVFGRIFGKVDKYNYPINREKKRSPFEAGTVRDEAYYSALPVSKYDKELELWYNNRTGSNMDITAPKTFNEKIQWLKIHDATMIKSHLSDKWLAKEYIRATLGEEYIVKTLGVYDSFDEIDFDALPDKFVIKSTHGSGQIIIVKDKALLNKDEARKKVERWLGKTYGFSCGFEIHYCNIIPRIIIEEFMEGIKDDLYDYKFMCLNGRVEFIWVDTDRFTDHRRNLYDAEWNLLSDKLHWPNSDKPVPKPESLDKLIELSESLAKPFACVRCDFYILPDGAIKFGELTFTSASGIDVWNPEAANVKFGERLELPSPVPFKKRSRAEILNSEKKFLSGLENRR